MGAFDLQDIPQLVYLGAIFVAVLGYAIAAHRRNLGPLLRHSALWFFIIIGTVAGIGLWNDFRSASSGLAQMRDTGRDIILSRAMDGHYYLTLQVNDVPVLFMIDTGASQIVLSRQDATRAGFNLEGIVFSGRANTANGRIPTAPVRIARLGLGTTTAQNIAAVINGGEMDHSLLGMEFLNGFRRIVIENGEMILER